MSKCIIKTANKTTVGLTIIKFYKISPRINKLSSEHPLVLSLKSKTVIQAYTPTWTRIKADNFAEAKTAFITDSWFGMIMEPAFQRHFPILR
jgi:hypothetical protein